MFSVLTALLLAGAEPSSYGFLTYGISSPLHGDTSRGYATNVVHLHVNDSTSTSMNVELLCLRMDYQHGSHTLDGLRGPLTTSLRPSQPEEVHPLGCTMLTNQTIFGQDSLTTCDQRPRLGNAICHASPRVHRSHHALAAPAKPVELSCAIAAPAMPVELSCAIAAPAKPVELSCAIPPRPARELSCAIAAPAKPVELSCAIAAPAKPAELSCAIAAPAKPAELSCAIAAPAKPGAELRHRRPGQARGAELRHRRPGRARGAELRIRRPGRARGAELCHRRPGPVRGAELRRWPSCARPLFHAASQGEYLLLGQQHEQVNADEHANAHAREHASRTHSRP